MIEDLDECYRRTEQRLTDKVISVRKKYEKLEKAMRDFFEEIVGRSTRS